MVIHWGDTPGSPTTQLDCPGELRFKLRTTPTDSVAIAFYEVKDGKEYGVSVSLSEEELKRVTNNLLKYQTDIIWQS